ncbi:MAG TPA: shikimate kinase [Terriglobales bacterium]|nr:shikimate kinase [Terriglobales bacterium]
MAHPASKQPLESDSLRLRTAVFLVGFMGAGKTSVGRALARQLHWRFIDLDERVEARERRTVAEIFRDRGETAFRQAESAALLELLDELRSGTRAVIALGGGAYVQPQNADLIHASNSAVVFLDAPIEELRRRCTAKGDVRPLFQDEDQFRKLYEARRAHYLHADFLVSTMDKSVYDVAREIISLSGIENR